MNTGAFVGMFVGIFVVLVFLILLFVYVLAKLGKFFTLCRGGEIVAIIVGEEPFKFIMAHTGFHLNDPSKTFFDERYPKWEVLPNKWGDPEDRLPNNGKWPEGTKNQKTVAESGIKNWFERTFGIYWVGLFPFKQVYIRDFSWSEVQQSEEGERKARARIERVSSIFAKDFPYLVTLKAAETASGVPVNVEYILTVRTTNPLKALFGTDDWYEQTTAAANRSARNLVGAEEFRELTSELELKGGSKTPDTKNKELFSKSIVALTKKVPDNTDGLSKLYGITIVGADPQSITLSDPSDKKSTVLVFEAKQKAEAEIITAKADKEATILRAEGEKQSLEMVGEVMQKTPAARQLRSLQALEKSQLRVLGNQAVIPTIDTGG